MNVAVRLYQTTLTMAQTQAQKLRRVEIREILKRHVGSIGELAGHLRITSQSVSMWLRGKGTSQRIADAAEKKALELLQTEKQESGAA